MSDKLSEAVALFKTLGWEKVNSDNVLDLPIGTPEQKKTALAGLKSGDWRAWSAEGTIWLFDVNPISLAAFAIRVGIDAKRLVSVLPPLKDNSDAFKMLEVSITSRGETFANRFILSACIDRHRILVNDATRYGRIAVALVHNIPLAVPQDVGYIKDWAAYCSPNWRYSLHLETQITSKKLIQKVKQRFKEHIQTAVDVGATVTVPMQEIMQWGIEQKCISKAKLRSLAITALNTPIRPLDRKKWLEILDWLNVSDKELCLHLEELLPVLSMGEAAVINRLAPVFIANADDNLVVTLLMFCFSCTSSKTRKIVLESALKRKRSSEAEQLTEWFSQLCSESDIKTVKLIEKLSTQWNLDTIPTQEETKIVGYWRETPSLWTVPKFFLGEVTPEALTQIAAKLMGQTSVVYDTTTERFLALANNLAYQDPEEVRISLRGLQSNHDNTHIIWYICHWVTKEPLRSGWDIPEEVTYGILHARDYMVTTHLGEQPCLLSTPSREDLSIRPEDLLERLKMYQKEGVKALEADLYLGMTRLIPQPQSAKQKEMWQSIDVAIVLQSGENMPITAGQAVLEWLLNPPQEPSLEIYEKDYWRCVSDLMDAIKFPPRLGDRDSWCRDSQVSAVFPLWGDAALENVVHWCYEADHGQGLNLRQVARHSTPFSANIMMNFLDAQHNMSTQDVIQDSHLAVMEAWQRGLLRPGLIDIKKFGKCSNLAGFSVYLDEIAQQGLLSLVWLIADPMILASCKASRMFAGTAEMAKLVRKYLPEAVNAVKKGIAEPTVLNLPGIHMLAARKGNSAAVLAARETVKLFPTISEMTSSIINIEQDDTLDPSFESVWPEPEAPCGVPDDGALVEVHLYQNSHQQSKKWLRFIITLPDQPDCIYQFVNTGWIYGLENEGQCYAYKTKPNAPWPGKEGDEVWLHWDNKSQKTIVCTNRDWAQEENGPLSCERTDLPFSLVVVSIGLMGQGSWESYDTSHLLDELVKHKELDAAIVNRVMEMLLKSQDFNPALMVRILEKDISYLHLLWPVLTQSIRIAGKQTEETGKPPIWINRILDTCIRNAAYLKKAAKLEYIPKKDAEWEGLRSIANCKAKSVAIAKAKEFAMMLF